ncbi:MAG TPA: 2-amino-4-hydroxy-6-hydroxymethyldihydropteridine diphosphokinase [Burkholderiaceae bacterium]|nr:2-amino-4-hydroxy-6-hydroxymethyldihydropteridine diphosphokinase [Burkholderiaceae bacterium]
MQAFVGVGANLGAARDTVLAAIDTLDRLPGTVVDARSRLYRSAPLEASGPEFVNAVVRLCTELEAAELLQALLGIERRHGRQRPHRNSPRTLDLDLLLYGEQRIDTPALTVPHPRLHERAFVLWPLADIDATLTIPGRGTVRELLARVQDQACVPL